MGLNVCEFFEDRARRVSEAGAALPHLEALPQHEGQKAYEDVSLDAVLALMPDWTDVELIFLDAESGFGLRELDVDCVVLELLSALITIWEVTV